MKSESEVAQSCPTPSDPMDCSLPGSSIHGISRQEYWSGVPLPSLLPSVKWWGAAVHHRELRSVLCDDPEGWDGEVRRRSKRVGIYV